MRCISLTLTDSLLVLRPGECSWSNVLVLQVVVRNLVLLDGTMIRINMIGTKDQVADIFARALAQEILSLPVIVISRVITFQDCMV